MVERLLAKEKVEGSNPFFRSIIFARLRSRQKPPMATTFTQPTDQLRHDIQAALEAGVPREDLLDLVNIAYFQLGALPLNPQSNGHIGRDLAIGDKELPIFTELPEGLIDLPSAQKKYGCTRARFRNWVTKGQLKVHGRLRAPARGGGYLVVSEDELVDRLTASPNKGGRPRKR